MIKLASIAIALVAFTGVAVADKSFSGNNEKATIDCAKDPNVSITGNGATITLTGTCANVNVAGNKATVTGSATTVMVAGNNNTLDLDVVDVLAVPGNSNTVSYRKSSDAKKPTKVSNAGNKNTVAKKK